MEEKEKRMEEMVKEELFFNLFILHLPSILPPTSHSPPLPLTSTSSPNSNPTRSSHNLLLLLRLVLVVVLAGSVAARYAYSSPQNHNASADAYASPHCWRWQPEMARGGARDDAYAGQDAGAVGQRGGHHSRTAEGAADDSCAAAKAKAEAEEGADAVDDAAWAGGEHGRRAGSDDVCWAGGCVCV